VQSTVHVAYGASPGTRICTPSLSVNEQRPLRATSGSDPAVPFPRLVGSIRDAFVLEPAVDTSARDSPRVGGSSSAFKAFGLHRAKPCNRPGLAETKSGPRPGQLLLARDQPALAGAAKRLARRVASASHRVIRTNAFFDEMVIKEPHRDQSLLEGGVGHPAPESSTRTLIPRGLGRVVSSRT
jgi:hypothetical protein